jgi:PAS domain S-box-containing protein
MIATELDSAQRLQHVATQLVNAQGLEALYEETLDTLIAILHADFATIQMFYPERGTNGELRLLGHRGFSTEVAKRWEWVSPATRTTCGEVLRTGRKIAVADIRNCDFMAGSEDLEGYLGTGIHAAQSLPLVSRSGALLGTVSTYWREPHELSASETRALDVLARLAADLIERSQAEEALWRSEERFRQVAESAGEFIWEVDDNGLYLYASRAVEQILGYTPEEIVGRMHFYDLFVPETRDEIKAAAFEVFARRDPFRAFPNLSVRKDGGVVALETNGLPILDGNGNLLGYRGADMDVTERKRAERSARENEQRLVSIYNTVRDVIFHLAVEPEGQFRFVSVNAAFLKVTGLSREAVVGKTVNEVIPEPSLTMVLEKYRQAVEENTVVVWEETSDYPTGRLIGKVSVAPVFDNKGRCTHLVGSVHDITEQVRAEQLLRKSEERLKNAERLAHVGHWDWDIRTQRVSWSEECFRIFGMSQKDTPSYEGLLQTVVPQDRERVAAWISHCLAEKRGNSIEFQIAWPNGDLKIIACISEVSVGDNGSPARMFGACQDVSDIRRAQEETVARQKLESVGTLANGIAHDFNNLLGGVLAQTELALAELAAGSSPEGELKAIKDVATQGSEIVRQLMIYAGKERESFGPVDVSRIVQDMLELLRISVSKHATLQTNLGLNRPLVRGNAAQLRQIVMNLVMNASEAIRDEDGVIRVCTRCVHIGRGSSEATLQQLAEGDYMQLEVSDTGCGIPQEMQARLFDPYFTTKSAGHGLGLAVVDGIVRSLCGEIQVASEPGKGTTFRILLPCAERTVAAIPGAMPPAEEAARPLQRATVLVVEDEDPLRQPVAKMLRKSGFEVLEAANGSAAMDLLGARGSKIDVILLDLTIPGPSSQAIVAEAARTRPDAKVILTSAYSEEMAAATKSGPQIRGFIRKPFRLGELVQTLRNILSS